MEVKRKIVSLIITQGCNLSCSYCSEYFKSSREMSFDIASKVVEKYLNDTEHDYDQCIIDFFGGEPFMNFPLMKQICEFVLAKEWKKSYLFSVTTNGTLIHGEIREWLLKNREKFIICLSFDGTKKMQDINRSKSFSKVDLDFLKKTWGDIEVKMTISMETLPDLAEGIIYLHSFGFKIISTLAYGIGWIESEYIQVLSREFGKLIDFYLKNPSIKPCNFLDIKIENKGYSEKKWCKVGDTVVFDVDGKNYPCKGFLPTTIGKEKSENSRTFDFALAENLLDFNCKGCMLYNLCETCYASNYREEGNMAQRDSEHCNLTKVRVLAASFLEAKKILSGKDSLTIKGNELSIIQSILLIQNYLPILQLNNADIKNLLLSEKEKRKLSGILTGDFGKESNPVNEYMNNAFEKT